MIGSKNQSSVRMGTLNQQSFDGNPLVECELSWVSGRASIKSQTHGRSCERILYLYSKIKLNFRGKFLSASVSRFFIRFLVVKLTRCSHGSPLPYASTHHFHTLALRRLRHPFIPRVWSCDRQCLLSEDSADEGTLHYSCKIKVNKPDIVSSFFL